MRYYARHEAKIALQDSLWRLTYDIDFDVTGPEGKCTHQSAHEFACR